jgi:hypothetical protein
VLANPPSIALRLLIVVRALNGLAITLPASKWRMEADSTVRCERYAIVIETSQVPKDTALRTQLRVAIVAASKYVSGRQLGDEAL